MTKLTAVVRVQLIALSLASPMAWSEEAPVTAYYDTKNNWFVFEWMNPESGKKQSFYDSANKVKPTIQALVSIDKASGVYTYTFETANLPGALQLLQQIFIPHPAAILGSSSPSDWKGSEYRNQNVWAWHRVGAVHGLPAGEVARGFSFKSKGLPTVVIASFAGARRVAYTIPSPDSDPDAVQSSFEQVFSELQAKYPDKFTDRVQLKTVGPTDPPATFDGNNFIQNLIALVNQSRAQGWIDNDGIANSLLAKLNNAASKAASDPQTAKNVLGAFLNDVQAQNGKHLSSEAYALLYFNGQYAVNHM